MRIYLGADIGGTKTHLALADENGQVLAFAHAGPGNHQEVGYDGMFQVLKSSFDQALAASDVHLSEISGAGFGIAGYDWPSQIPDMLATIARLDLNCPVSIVNDAIPPLVAGAQEGWGIGLVAGTGCNCRGRDPSHQNEGRVTGYGAHMGEFAGASELVWRAMQLVASQWMQRGSKTALSDAFIEYAGAADLDDLIEGYTEERYQIGAQAAIKVFEVAHQGDPVAQDLIRWAGQELGELANAVIRQLGFELLEFDVILSGSMFEGGTLLIEPLCETIAGVAPGARLVRLHVPPVIGAVLIGMEQGGVQITPRIRKQLEATIFSFQSLEKTKPTKPVSSALTE